LLKQDDCEEKTDEFCRDLPPNPQSVERIEKLAIDSNFIEKSKKPTEIKQNASSIILTMKSRITAESKR